MKLSCLPVSYFSSLISGKMTIEHWADEAAGLGLDGIDLSILFFEKNRDSRHLAEIRKKITSAGLKLAVLNTYPDLTHPSQDYRNLEFA